MYQAFLNSFVSPLPSAIILHHLLSFHHSSKKEKNKNEQGRLNEWYHHHHEMRMIMMMRSFCTSPHSLLRVQKWRKISISEAATKSNFSHFRSTHTHSQNLMNEGIFPYLYTGNNFSWFCTIKHETALLEWWWNVHAAISYER